MVCLGLLMLSTYRYPPSAGVMSKCSSHYQCTIFFPLRNDSLYVWCTPSTHHNTVWLASVRQKCTIYLSEGLAQ